MKRIVDLILVAIVASQAVAQDAIVVAAWELQTHEEREFLLVTGSNGLRAAVPSSRYGTELATAYPVLAAHDVRDPLAMYQALQAAGVDGLELRAADALCWDLAARSAGQPLCDLIGRERESIPRYGDLRWRDDDTPASYASRLSGISLPGMKLHLPGSYAVDGFAPNPGLPVADIIEALRLCREARPDIVLAYDPHPQVAAALTYEDAAAIMAACDQYQYEWIEAPLPFNDDSNDDNYRMLKENYSTRIQLEESTSLGSYQVFLDWMQKDAIDQWCPSVYPWLDTGLTQVVQEMQWIEDNQSADIFFNIHYPAIEHVHFAFTMSSDDMPYLEAPYVSSDQFRTSLYQPCQGPDGTAIAPTWPGIYDLPWLNTDLVLQAQALSHAQVQLSWQPIPTADWYTIQWQESAATDQLAVILKNVTANSHRCENLEPETEYRFHVTADK